MTAGISSSVKTLLYLAHFNTWQLNSGLSWTDRGFPNISQARGEVLHQLNVANTLSLPKAFLWSSFCKFPPGFIDVSAVGKGLISQQSPAIGLCMASSNSCRRNRMFTPRKMPEQTKATGHSYGCFGGGGHPTALSCSIRQYLRPMSKWRKF